MCSIKSYRHKLAQLVYNKLALKGKSRIKFSLIHFGIVNEMFI